MTGVDNEVMNCKNMAIFGGENICIEGYHFIIMVASAHNHHNNLFNANRSPFSQIKFFVISSSCHLSAK